MVDAQRAHPASLFIFELAVQRENGITWFDVEGECLSRHRFDKDLHGDATGGWRSRSRRETSRVCTCVGTSWAVPQTSSHEGAITGKSA